MGGILLRFPSRSNTNCCDSVSKHLHPSPSDRHLINTIDHSRFPTVAGSKGNDRSILRDDFSMNPDSAVAIDRKRETQPLRTKSMGFCLRADIDQQCLEKLPSLITTTCETAK